MLNNTLVLATAAGVLALASCAPESPPEAVLDPATYIAGCLADLPSCDNDLVHLETVWVLVTADEFGRDYLEMARHHPENITQIVRYGDGVDYQQAFREYERWTPGG